MKRLLRGAAGLLADPMLVCCDVLQPGYARSYHAAVLLCDERMNCTGTSGSPRPVLRRLSERWPCPQARGLPQAVHPEELAGLLARHPSPSSPHMDSVVRACLRPVHTAEVRRPHATPCH